MDIKQMQKELIAYAQDRRCTTDEQAIRWEINRLGNHCPEEVTNVLRAYYGMLQEKDNPGNRTMRDELGFYIKWKYGVTNVTEIEEKIREMASYCPKAVADEGYLTTDVQKAYRTMCIEKSMEAKQSAETAKEDPYDGLEGPRYSSPTVEAQLRRAGEMLRDAMSDKPKTEHESESFLPSQEELCERVYKAQMEKIHGLLKQASDHPDDNRPPAGPPKEVEPYIPIHHKVDGFGSPLAEWVSKKVSETKGMPEEKMFAYIVQYMAVMFN